MSKQKWIWRLAAGVSVIWLLATYFATESSETFRWFLLVGVLPVVSAWVFYWVWLAYRDSRKTEPTRFPFRINRRK